MLHAERAAHRPIDRTLVSSFLPATSSLLSRSIFLHAPELLPIDPHHPCLSRPRPTSLLSTSGSSASPASSLAPQRPGCAPASLASTSAGVVLPVRSPSSPPSSTATPPAQAPAPPRLRPGHGRARAGLPRPGALPLPPLRPLLPSIPPVPTPGAAPVRPRVTAAVALLLLASVLRPVAAGLPPPCLSCCCCSRLLFRCHVTVCPRCLRARACAAAAPGCPRASGAAPCLRLPFPRCPVRARCVVSPCRVPVSRREAPIPDVFPFPTLSRREPSSPFRREASPTQVLPP